ncbi:NRDE family protein [Natrononativus amylolyticus]|uniref:NRDE family protein n=1 Tax=Natrononativus amylolyticus TaxID=2963434 RepID=UPI0020CE2EDC|nr:NRDE family protein [Natrononativus amylolyticus]
MCTLTLAWQVFEDAPVAVAANRDEALDRPAGPPDVYRASPLVIAPHDVEAGGTWIGVNEHGVFAGITNRWTERDLAGERSRGLLVADVLETTSAADAAAHVERTTSEHEYEGFNLVVADAEDAIHLGWDGSLSRTAFDPGVHVVVNVGFDETFALPAERRDLGERQAESARAVREALEPRDDERVEGWLERAGTVLGDHEYGVCIHGDGYGTRSSSLLAVGERTRYEFADGPPCRTAYEPVGIEGQF